MKKTTLTAMLILMGSIGFAQQKKFWDRTRLNEIIEPSSTEGCIRYKKENKITSAMLLTEFKESFRLGINDELRLLKSVKDQYGFVHEKYQQYYLGSQVDGAVYSFHLKQGFVMYSTGKLAHGLALTNDKLFTPENAILSACKQIYPDRKFEPDELRSIKNKLIIVENGSDWVYAYKLTLEANFVYVDANTGDVLRSEPIAIYCSPGTFVPSFSSYGPVLNFQTNHRGFPFNDYELQDNCRDIETRKATSVAINGLVIQDNRLFDNDNSWSLASERPYTTLHWAMQKTFDFYNSPLFSRLSFDNAGATVNAFGNNNSGGNLNAFYLNPNHDIDPTDDQFSFGPGATGNDGMSALDIVGHEFTHGVIAFEANLGNTGETGALGESFGDIFGSMVEDNFFGSTDWIMGAVTAAGKRSLSHPANFTTFPGATDPDPSFYKGVGWRDATNTSQANDFGGVHSNCGVQNYWFYLLCEGQNGGTNEIGDEIHVTAIGKDNALKIVYYSIQFLLAPTSEYADAREQSILAAQSIFGECSNEVMQVMNAWNAVGVGHGGATIETATPDLWIKDNPANIYTNTAEDNGAEPNTGLFWNIVDGNDIWIRNSAATQIQSNPARYQNEHDHENADWSPHWATDPNSLPRIYVKVRNRSCTEISGNVHIYMHNISATDHWNTCNGSQCGSWKEIGVQSISLKAGEAGVVEQVWTDAQNFPDPNDNSLHYYHHCLLARLVCDGGVDQIINEQVGVSAAINAQASNNITQKNVLFIDAIPGFTPPPNIDCFAFGNFNSFPTVSELVTRDQSQSQLIGEHGFLTVELSPALYQAWVQGGRQGEGFKAEKAKFDHTSPSGMSHRHSGEQTSQSRMAGPNVIVIDAPMAFIQNMGLPANDPFPTDPDPICPEFMFIATSEPPIAPFEYVFSEDESPGNGPPVYNFIGAVKYYVTKPTCPEADAGRDVTADKDCITTLTVSPVDPDATYTWRNSRNGMDMGSGPSIQVSPRVTTTYELEASFPNRCIDYDEVTVTVNSQNTCLEGTCRNTDYDNYTLHSNLTINEAQVTINRTLTVPNEMTLTIINSELKFTENAEIVVMSGGKLSISNSRLRSCDITKKWAGITINGSNTDPDQISISNSAITEANSPVIMTEVMNPVITQNTFDNGGAAIFMDKCKNFTIRQNEFFNYNIGVKAGRSIEDLSSGISQNHFVSVRTPVLLVDGNNSTLRINCNLFEDYMDYAILCDNTILSDQGSLSEGAGNSFISNSTLINHQFHHNGNAITYFYDPSEPLALATGTGLNVAGREAESDGPCIGSGFKTYGPSNELTPNSSIDIGQNAAASELISCIPNPAVTTATILFRLVDNSKAAEIIITNVVGERVAKIPTIKGSNSVMVNCESFSNGIYFYSLVLDGTTVSTKKMIVTK